MPLEALPPELLTIILRYVGASELRRTTACGLPVCKWWYRLAEPILLEDLSLSSRQLLEIPRHRIEVSKHRTQHMTIDVSLVKGDEVLVPCDLENPWDTVLTRRLNELNTWIKECSRLQSLSLRIQHDMSPEEVTFCESLGSWELGAFANALWTPKLSSLKLDTLGAWVIVDERLCTEIARRIPSLRSVWLQLHTFCPEVLCFDEYLEQGSYPPPKIEKIVISLSVVRHDSDIARFSGHCGSEADDSEILDMWKTRAKEAIRLVPSINQLWLLCHEKDAGNSPELFARDFVSNLCREFERHTYDMKGFDPTDRHWSYLDTEVVEEDEETGDYDDD